jgi:two-component sensor histidine kinase
MSAEETGIQHDFNKLRENKILDVIMSYARLDFSEKTIISDKGDVFDAIGAGVNMQTENIQDEKFLALIRESRNRIKSMALVHEMLYATTDLSSIKLKSYITTLYESIYQSYRRPDMQVNFDIDIKESISFEIDKMIHLGLILNEIISNSLKYAFDNNNGTISICLQQTGYTYLLTIKDNGKGLPVDFDVKKHSSLGMQLIHMLTEQINGILKIEPNKGVAYKIQF